MPSPVPPLHVSRILRERGYAPPTTPPDLSVASYLRRWQLDASETRCVYLHLMAGPDKPLLHSHPYGFETEVLQGGYVERRYEDGDRRMRTVSLRAGDVAAMSACDVEGAGPWHAIVAVSGLTWTLVKTGPRLRGWGFLLPTAPGIRPLGKAPAPETHGYLPHRQADSYRQAIVTDAYHVMGDDWTAESCDGPYPQISEASPGLLPALADTPPPDPETVRSWRRRGHRLSEIGAALGRSRNGARRAVLGTVPEVPSPERCAAAALALRERPHLSLRRHAADFNVSPSLFMAMLRGGGVPHPKFERAEPRSVALARQMRAVIERLGGEASASEIKRHLGMDVNHNRFVRGMYRAGAYAIGAGPATRWRLDPGMPDFGATPAARLGQRPS